jgi:hypothetical protein
MVPGVIVIEFASSIFAMSDFNVVFTLTIPGRIGIAG